VCAVSSPAGSETGCILESPETVNVVLFMLISFIINSLSVYIDIRFCCRNDKVYDDDDEHAVVYREFTA